MSYLEQEYLEPQEQGIEDQKKQIEDLQKQLRELQKALRSDELLHRARQAADREIDQWMTGGEKLAKDICSIYPPDAIVSMAKEISDRFAAIAQQHQQYAASKRFLNPSADSEDDATDNNFTPGNQNNNGGKTEPEVVEVAVLEAQPDLPDSDDTVTPLTSEQIEYILKKENSEDLILEVRNYWEISSSIKKLPTLAKYLEKKDVTHEALINAIAFSKEKLARESRVS